MTLEQLGLGSDPPNGSSRERGATRIDWYINKGQISSTASNVMMCHSDS